MKNKIMQLFLVIGLIIGGASFIYAGRVTSIHAKIPFDFMVGSKSFKAGKYSVTFGLVSTNAEYFLIRSADGKDSVIVAGVRKQTGEQANDSVLVFNLDENNYSLTEVTTPRISLGLQKSKAAKGKQIEVKLEK